MSQFVDNIDYVSPGELNLVNDPVCGGLVSSGTGAAPRPGQLGKKGHMTQDEAYARYGGSKVINGVALPQLYSGIYQYVQFLSHLQPDLPRRAPSCSGSPQTRL